MDRWKLRAELIHDEGLRLTPYKDTVGLWTIGVGHLLGSGVNPRMTAITYDEAMALLDHDIDNATTVVSKVAPSLLGISAADYSDVRLRAVTNMAFNLGPKLGEFKHFLAAIAKADWDAAATAMMDSKWAKQVGLRATRLQKMILTGEEPV